MKQTSNQYVRKFRFFFALLLIATLMMSSAGVALAVGAVGTTAGFEDDDGNLAPQPTINFDWNSFAPTTWNGSAPYRQSEAFTGGWSFKGVEDAQKSSTDTAFAGGTKQDKDCPTVIGASAPNKDDLKRIYLSSKVVGGHTYLMLAWVRITQNTTSPSAHIGFEFNKGNNGACGGSSDGLVKRSAGDMLIVYDFEGGSTDNPTLTLRRWVTSGACEVGSNSPPCWGPSTNLTASGFAEAKVNTTLVGTVQDNIGPAAEVLGLNEFGEAGIDLTAAGVFQQGVCESFGKAFGVSRSSGSSATAQMKDLAGPVDFSLANCGKVIIRKVTDPSGDTTTSFGYTTNVSTTPPTTTSPFSLKDGGSNTIDNVNPGSSLHVTEDDPGPNYKLDSINCSASSVPSANYATNTTTRAVTFSIAAGETLDCTFTNKLQQGAIKVSKTSIKGDAPLSGAKFSVSGPSGNFTLTTGADGTACVDQLSFGDYDVTETEAPGGYQIDDPDPRTITVDNNATCEDQTYVGKTSSFSDTPLSEIRVQFKSLAGAGVTNASIICTLNGATVTPTPADGTPDPAVYDDTDETITNLAPGVYTCIIDVDP